jgi:hypothetical protein
MRPLAAWGTQGVFSSSPFADFHVERDCVQQVVLPALEERLRGANRRLHLSLVDLRLGVETASLADEQAKEALILKVCLDEIDCCRPFFVLLLGDRYGSVMPRERLEAAAREAGLQVPVEGMSVTALEAEYGIFHMPEGQETEQKPRLWVYIRDPLPYERMPADTRVRYLETNDQGRERLQQLKARLEKELPGRVRHYQASWDDEK